MVEEDEVLYDEHPAMFRRNPIAFILMVVLIPVVVGLVLLIGWWIDCMSRKLTVTHYGTKLRKGILSKHVTEVRNSDVRSVSLKQNVMQRICNVGDLAVATAGHSGIEIAIKGIPFPEKAKAAIERGQRA